MQNSNWDFLIRCCLWHARTSCIIFKAWISASYTVLHIFTQVLFWAEYQENHQNFDPSLLFYKCWLIFIRMKLKKTSPNSQYFFTKIIENWSWKSQFFWAGHFEFFCQFFFASSQWKPVNIYKITRMCRNFDDCSGFQPKTTPA